MADLDLIALAPRLGLVLQRRGAHYVARCPLHAERTPSFKIRVDRPTRWRCYGACAAGGDALDLIGRLRFGAAWDPHDRAQFRAVVDALGPKSLPAPGPAAPAPGPATLTPDALDLLERALTLYERELWGLGGGRATPLRTLRARGFTDETLRRQRVGYCSGTRLARAAGDVPLAAGLLRPRSGRDPVEHLRGRIVLPDLDARGRARYLTGRAWAPWLGRASKYLCLPGLPPPLYGLALLAPGTSPVLVTESLADWLTLRQWGYAALGTSGTGLSPAQTRALQALGRPLVYAVQSDAAGRAAGARWQRAVGRGRVLGPPVPFKDLNDLLVAGQEARFHEALAALLLKEGQAREPP